MLLHLYQLPLPFSSKTLNLESPWPLFPQSQFLSHLNPKPSKFIPHSSPTTIIDTQTVSKTAIQRIQEKLRSLGYIEEDSKDSKPHHGSAGEIFLPSSQHLAKTRVGYTIDSSWSTPENPVPEPGSGTAITRFHQLKREVRKHKSLVKREDVVPNLAELTIPVEELRRLRGIGVNLKKKLKVGKAGITEGIVNGIHERWRQSELVKIACEDLCRMNMKRTHDLLEVCHLLLLMVTTFFLI
ncbi:hypothetical protein GIB67_032937 [Kingdonia uniflora]|uniref:CRM domain-containing protein n=1 Tax=Kingdonia uniflora TaxID=39325 RepID=A0A7J7MY91_9MAGN|nr:hypothetical protein GIB67_032937 [Kingdonia uniflora]